MDERILRGRPASPGQAAGRVRRVGEPAAEVTGTVPETERPAELERARHALARAGEELAAVAGRLRAAERAEEADIVETGVLMAADPVLDGALEDAVMRRGRPAPAALVDACAVHADAIAAVGDPVLAQRADDVRSLGRRAARVASAPAPAAPEAAPAGAVVLVADDLGPADVAELADAVAAVALARGGPSAHAAVVARGLGVPMAVGLGSAILAAEPGTLIAVDGSTGEVALRPRAERLAALDDARGARRQARDAARAARDLPSVTRDGRPVRVLVNASTAAETRAGLDAGVEGIGLLRSELTFLDARGWPDQAAHERALAPVLAALAGRLATVRVLDFGGDKTPPFLAGVGARGLALLLEAPEALAAQLRALAAAARDGAQLRVLLPMVQDAGQVGSVRGLLEREFGAMGLPVPPVGAMIETAAAARGADAIAAAADFLSIGTNDLTASTLGADRFSPGAGDGHDPRVLALIAAVTHAAAGAGRFVEVCGEAASEPLMVPLLTGYGVAELSVGAARVGATRGWIRALDAAACERVAEQAISAADAAAVAAIAGGLLPQAGDAGGERADRGVGVLPVGRQP